MTTEYSGGGDPKRSIELLWGTAERSRRGPRPRLTVAQVAAAAIELADAEGLAALSMRRVAERLGVTAMSLYTYVPGKAELVDVMLDTVYGELPPPVAGVAGWRAGLAAVARETWALYRRHPWLLQVATSRPVLGPNTTARYEHELRLVDGIGLSDVEMDLLVRMVGDYVHGAVRGAVAAAQVQTRSGLTDEQWWQQAGPVFEAVFDAGRFPVAARVGAAAGQEFGAASDPARSFEFGLQRLLDGVELFVDRRRAGRPGV